MPLLIFLNTHKFVFYMYTLQYSK